MSELLEVFRRETGRFREFREALERLKVEVRRSRELERELAELIEKVKGEELKIVWSAPFEILTGEEPNPSWSLGELVIKLRCRWSERPNPLEILRRMRRRAARLRKAIELAEALELPEPPSPTFSRALDLEAEFPLEDGLRRVRVVGIRLGETPFPPDATLHPDPGVWVIFELGGEKRRKIEEPSDLLFLLPICGQVIELLKEATRRYEEYNRGLEAFKKRFSSEHSRKILMASL